MSNGIIAILDCEADYALKLAEYFNLKSGLNDSVSVFTDFESLEHYIYENKIDILLISEKFSSQIEKLHNISNIMILTEGNIDGALKDYLSLYKYQPSDNILRDVMSCYASSSAKTISVSAATSAANIIGIYSPIKRCGKTSFALAYGCILSRSGPNLYINLEEYAGFSYFTRETPMGDFSDLLYFYRQNPCSISKKLMSLCRDYHNLSYIPPMQFSYDIKNMESEDLRGLISAIADTGYFENIILDISDSLKNVPELLEICKLIYMPVTKDLSSHYKINDFLESISTIFGTSIQEKMKQITLPFADSKLFSQNDTDVPTSDFMENLLFSEFGIFTRNLIEN